MGDMGGLFMNYVKYKEGSWGFADARSERQIFSCSNIDWVAKCAAVSNLR